MKDIVDVVVRRKSRGSMWWRVSLTASRYREDFEDGHDDTLYAGLIERWAKRVGVLNFVVMRMPRR